MHYYSIERVSVLFTLFGVHTPAMKQKIAKNTPAMKQKTQKNTHAMKHFVSLQNKNCDLTT